MGMYQPEIETMDRNELEKLQLERLQKQVKNVYENVPMYRERMDKKGVKPEDIKELKDLAKLPFTTKQDLRDYYPMKIRLSRCHTVTACSQAVWVHTAVLKESVL